LAIQIASQALVSDGIRICSKRALRDAVGRVPLLLLEDDNVSHIVRSVIGAFCIAPTVCQERKVVLTHNTVFVRCAIAEFASGMTANISYLDVLVPFGFHMSEDSKLILLASDKLHISI